MPCRVGMTTDLDRRKAEHERKYKNARDWSVLHEDLDRASAEALEAEEAKERGCDSHGGGDDPDDPNKKWLVYYFRHDGEK